MVDIFTIEKRSKVMSAVKHRGSKIEIKMASIFRGMKIRYRSHPQKFTGKPDFYLPDLDAIVFIDSCFWHGCRYHGSLPKSNKKFWVNKITQNKNRDRAVNRSYKKLGRNVVRIWEHALKKPSGETVVRNALRILK